MGAGTKPKKNLAIRIMTAPYRIICKAKDFYVRSITNCANHTTYGRAAVMGNHGHIPRTYSTANSFASNDSSAEDLRDLIRANSTTYMVRQTRSASVGMGRIDEDAPISDEGKEKSQGLRSKSYDGVTTKRCPM